MSLIQRLKKHIGSSRIYKNFRDRIPDPIVDNDEDFKQIYSACKNYTMTSKLKMYALYKAVKYVVFNDIKGHFVECGVWKGGSCMLIIKTLQLLGIDDRKIVLYDTFEGMPEPSAQDVAVFNNNLKAHDIWAEKKEGWYVAKMQEVKNSIDALEYPDQNIRYVKGLVEDTIPNKISPSICLLRLDTDWYSSTKHELQYLYPILTPRGVLIIDDYGSWAGARRAVDEYFDDKLLLNRIDPTGRIALKI